jgi:hypothetical protein
MSSLNACKTINHSKQQSTKKQRYQGKSIFQADVTTLKTFFDSYLSKSGELIVVGRGSQK